MMNQVESPWRISLVKAATMIGISSDEVMRWSQCANGKNAFRTRVASDVARCGSCETCDDCSYPRSRCVVTASKSRCSGGMCSRGLWCVACGSLAPGPHYMLPGTRRWVRPRLPESEPARQPIRLQVSLYRIPSRPSRLAPCSVENQLSFCWHPVFLDMPWHV